MFCMIQFCSTSNAMNSFDFAIIKPFNNQKIIIASSCLNSVLSLNLNCFSKL